MTNEEVLWIEDTIATIIGQGEMSEENQKNLEKIQELLTGMYDRARERIESEQTRAKLNYADYHPVTEASRVVHALTNAVSLFNSANSDLEYYNNEASDILHAVEMIDLEEEDTTQLIKDLKRNRIQRRKCKTFIELVDPLRKLTEKHPGFIKDLKQTQSEINRIQRIIENRQYTPREKTTMEIKFAQAKEAYQVGKAL